MTIHEASRTLLKSPPELWAECSDATSLSRHLDQFGEIKITRLEPETAVAWEGENVSGTVKLESSGWGTRVILTAEEIDPVIAVAHAEPEPPSDPEAVAEPELVADPMAEPQPEPEPELVPETELAAQAEAGPQHPQPQLEISPKIGFFARLFGRKRKLAWPQVEPVAPAHQPAAEPGPVVETAASEPPIAEVLVVQEMPQELPVEAESNPGPDPGPTVEPESTEQTPEATIRALTRALESLGMAHHRPFSRS